MGKFKVLFEGEKVVVVKLNGDMSVQDLVDQGIFIQRMNELYDKRGRKVIISQSEFFRAGPPKLTGGVVGQYMRLLIIRWLVRVMWLSGDKLEGIRVVTFWLIRGL